MSKNPIVFADSVTWVSTVVFYVERTSAKALRQEGNKKTNAAGALVNKEIGWKLKSGTWTAARSPRAC